MTRFRALLAMLAALCALSLVVVDADAASRIGGGGSFGSRGGRTAMPPAATRTAPSVKQAAPSAVRPGAPAAPGGFFSRSGLLGGLAGGLLGAGIFGLLFGHGLFGGGGFAGILGLLIQIVIVVWVARLIMRWWQGRSQPAYAGPTPGDSTVTPLRPTAMNSMAAGNAAPPPGEPIEIGPSDYDAFERLLTEVQSAYSREDMNALKARLTPEMMADIGSDLAANASRGVVADLSSVKLLQGDLSEAWREGDIDYATVAMKYEIVDKLVDRATRRVVEGQDAPVEVTELWTFMRAQGGNWLLTAIQQPES
jgi:predicted lipid-binding transport protein (Tim44 family)